MQPSPLFRIEVVVPNTVQSQHSSLSILIVLSGSCRNPFTRCFRALYRNPFRPLFQQTVYP